MNGFSDQTQIYPYHRELWRWGLWIYKKNTLQKRLNGFGPRSCPNFTPPAESHRPFLTPRELAIHRQKTCRMCWPSYRSMTWSSALLMWRRQKRCNCEIHASVINVIKHTSTSLRAAMHFLKTLFFSCALGRLSRKNKKMMGFGFHIFWQTKTGDKSHWHLPTHLPNKPLEFGSLPSPGREVDWTFRRGLGFQVKKMDVFPPPPHWDSYTKKKVSQVDKLLWISNVKDRIFFGNDDGKLFFLRFATFKSWLSSMNPWHPLDPFAGFSSKFPKAFLQTSIVKNGKWPSWRRATHFPALFCHFHGYGRKSFFRQM